MDLDLTILAISLWTFRISSTAFAFITVIVIMSELRAVVRQIDPDVSHIHDPPDVGTNLPDDVLEELERDRLLGQLHEELCLDQVLGLIFHLSVVHDFTLSGAVCNTAVLPATQNRTRTCYFKGNLSKTIHYHPQTLSQSYQILLCG